MKFLESFDDHNIKSDNPYFYFYKHEPKFVGGYIEEAQLLYDYAKNVSNKYNKEKAVDLTIKKIIELFPSKFIFSLENLIKEGFSKQVEDNYKNIHKYFTEFVNKDYEKYKKEEKTYNDHIRGPFSILSGIVNHNQQSKYHKRNVEMITEVFKKFIIKNAEKDHDVVKDLIRINYPGNYQSNTKKTAVIFKRITKNICSDKKISSIIDNIIQKNPDEFKKFKDFINDTLLKKYDYLNKGLDHIFFSFNK